jgi:hypothetical protein
MKVHRLIIYVADPNYNQSLEDLKASIDQYGLEDQIVYFGKTESIEIGEWEDDSFWNKNHKSETLEKEFNKYKK